MSRRIVIFLLLILALLVPTATLCTNTETTQVHAVRIAGVKHHVVFSEAMQASFKR